jgi:phosphatidate cytidylyltransferase
MAIPAFALMTMRLVLSRNEERPYPAFGVVLAASVYVGGLLSYAILLRSVDQGREWMLLLLLVVFATDTTAFFGGRAFGKTPLAPNISPSKTREGAVAGMFGAVAASVLAANLLGIHAIMVETILLGVLVGALAQLGDLVESRLKRKAGVKDSGALVPGHGGILDRLDSIVFTLPAVYYFVIWEVQQKGLLS